MRKKLEVVKKKRCKKVKIWMEGFKTWTHKPEITPLAKKHHNVQKQTVQGVERAYHNGVG